MDSVCRLWSRNLLLVLVTSSLVFSPSLLQVSANAGSIDFSNSFDGTTTSVIGVANDRKLEPDFGAFTLEMWVKENSRVNDNRYGPIFWGSTVFGTYGSPTPGAISWGLNWDCNGFAIAHSGQSCPYMAGTDDANTSQLAPANYYTLFKDHLWHHIAISKLSTGGEFSFYLDGLRVAHSLHDLNRWWLQGGNLVIGSTFAGSISNVRLVKGQGLYSGPNISVPNSELTTTSQGAVASNVSLLLTVNSSCQIQDSSLNHFLVTNAGAVCNNLSRPTSNITYALNYPGGGSAPNQDPVFQGSSFVIASNPTRSGWQFLGWSDNGTSSGNIYGGSTSNTTYLVSTSDVTLTALWQAPPDSPTIRTIDRVGDTGISVSYTAGASNGSAITGYTVTSSPTVALTLTSTVTANPLTYTGPFVQGQAYSFTMTETNGVGTSPISSVSNSITPYLAGVPDQVMIDSATVVNAATISIPFTAPASHGSAITTYSVTSIPALPLTYSGLTSPIAISGSFVQGQSYTFSVAAANSVGAGPGSLISNSIIPYPAVVPETPTIGSVNVTSGTSVNVSFNAPSNNGGSAITRYTATSSPGGITGISSGAASSVSVTGLTTGISYTFTVKATNAVGDSPLSMASLAIIPILAPVAAPDPVQRSLITSISPSFGTLGQSTTVVISGSFLEKISVITYGNTSLPSGSWIQTPSSVTFLVSNMSIGNYAIQVFNGSVPLLPVQNLLIKAAENAVANTVEPSANPTPSKTPIPIIVSTPTPKPVPNPSSSASPVVNIKPTGAMKEVAHFGFGTNSYFLNDTSKNGLVLVAKQIMESNSHTVLIYGNTDSRTGVDNGWLSRQRAVAVVKFIRPLLKGKNVVYGWYAATKPLVTGESKAAYAANRRVEIWTK